MPPFVLVKSQSRVNKIKASALARLSVLLNTLFLVLSLLPNNKPIFVYGVGNKCTTQGTCNFLITISSST